MSLVTFMVFTKKKNTKNPSKMYIYAYLPRAILLGVASFDGAELGFRTVSIDGVALVLRVGFGVMF